MLVFSVHLISALLPTEQKLVKLAALAGRGQSGGDSDRALARSLIEGLERAAPDTSALELNGRWRLLYASEAVYRSSPFFWAFRQATNALTSPVGFHSAHTRGVHRLTPFHAMLWIPSVKIRVVASLRGSVPHYPHLRSA